LCLIIKSRLLLFLVKFWQAVGFYDMLKRFDLFFEVTLIKKLVKAFVGFFSA